MLYNKNGVITEERFKKMTVFQWIFHYCEITNVKGEDQLLLLNSLGDIETSIQAFYMIVDGKAGSQMINKVSEIKKELRKKQKEYIDGGIENTSEENDNLSEEDRELLEFMNEQPLTMDIDNEEKSSEFILPKKMLDKKISDKVVTVDSKDDVEIPKLGL